jgi:hypothetical protein
MMTSEMLIHTAGLMFGHQNPNSPAAPTILRISALVTFQGLTQSAHANMEAA